jgi:hypothetical protein
MIFSIMFPNTPFARGVSMITELGHRVALKLLEVEEILENRSKKRES